MNPTQKALAERIQKRSRAVTPEEGRHLLDEYLNSDPPTSYRALAKKHGRAVGTVMRAIKWAAEEAGKPLAVLLVVLLLSIDGWGCAGHAQDGAAEPELFGWCCDGICGLDPYEADTFEQCECPGGFIRPVPETRGACLPLVEP